MRGVLGLLLIVAGLEGAYLVLAGKLPLQIKTTGNTGGGPDSLHPVKVYRGYPIASIKGLVS